jgi:hypothetical protein
MFLKYTQWQCILSYDDSTAMYKFLKKSFTLAGIEPVIFCSIVGRDDHYATPPVLYIHVEYLFTYLFILYKTVFWMANAFNSESNSY